MGDQREALKAIETYESEIAAAKVVTVACAEKKKMILEKRLRGRKLMWK